MSLVGIVVPTGAVYTGAAAQAIDSAAQRQAQGEANSRPGPRSVPARTIALPSGVDPATAKLVAAPYSPFWNWDPPTDDAWRAMLRKADAEALPGLRKDRATLGVSLTPTTLGGVKAFVLTPRQIPDAHRNQVVLHFHGGGYVFGAGESGTGEAALMAAYGGYKVIAVDYRMPPDAPYPAAMDDAVAAYKALLATTDPKRIAVEGTSTGGGMTLALMLRLEAEGLPLPGAIAPGSPWSDMTDTGDSYQANK